MTLQMVLDRDVRCKLCYQGLQGYKTIDKLIKFDPKFKEDLTSLYMNTGQFDAALN
jgi:hypothetical protein